MHTLRFSLFLPYFFGLSYPYSNMRKLCEHTYRQLRIFSKRSSTKSERRDQHTALVMKCSSTRDSFERVRNKRRKGKYIETMILICTHRVKCFWIGLINCVWGCSGDLKIIITRILKFCMFFNNAYQIGKQRKWGIVCFLMNLGKISWFDVKADKEHFSYFVWLVILSA